jgi:hypothetical protein
VRRPGRGNDLFEAVREIRRAGARSDAKPITYFEHIQDHLLFPSLA